MEPLWTIGEVAAYLRVPVETLYEWRKKSRARGRQIGPQAGRVGKHLRYDPEEVRSWFKSQAKAAA